MEVDYETFGGFVNDEISLSFDLSNSSSLEPLELKAQDTEEVYQTIYKRIVAKDYISEYLDVYFKDGKSHVLIVFDHDVLTVVCNPDCPWKYKGDRLFMFNRKCRRKERT